MHQTSPNRPTDWKVTEVADLHGDRMLVLHGDLDIATTPELVEMLQRLHRHGHAVAVDLAEVTFMDSTGLSALMEARRARAGSFAIKRPSPAVRRVFELAGVERLLDE